MFVVITRVDVLGMVNKKSQNEILEWMRLKVKKKTKTKSYNQDSNPRSTVYQLVIDNNNKTKYKTIKVNCPYDFIYYG